MNVMTSIKNSCNMHKKTFIQVFRPFEPNWVRKSYFWSDLRFQNCLITRLLPTTSILVLIERIYRYQMKLHYLKKLSIFCYIFFSFLESELNFQCFAKKMSVIAQVFLNLLTPRDVVVSIHNTACFLKAYCSERVNESQKLLQYAEKNFYPTFSCFWAKLS